MFQILAVVAILYSLLFNSQFVDFNRVNRQNDIEYYREDLPDFDENVYFIEKVTLNPNNSIKFNITSSFNSSL